MEITTTISKYQLLDLLGFRINMEGAQYLQIDPYMDDLVEWLVAQGATFDNDNDILWEGTLPHGIQIMLTLPAVIHDEEQTISELSR